MRLLVIGQNLPWLNPTSSLILNALSRQSNCFVTGRNFKEQFNTVHDLKAAKGTFDVALVEPWALSDDPPEPYRPCQVAGLRDSGIPIIMNFMQYDLHHLSKEFFEQYVVSGTCCVTTASDRILWPKDFSKLYDRESWLQPCFVTENPEAIDKKIVLMPHCLAQDEFIELNTKRPIDVSIPGTGYFFRRLVRDRVRIVRDLTVSDRPSAVQKALAMISLKWGGRLGPVLGMTRAAQMLFRRNLSKSMVGITCHGTVNYPIRKFFEIPAAGCLLVANMFQPSEALGFKSMTNCVDITSADLDGLEDVLRWAVSDAADVRVIRQSGQDMVRECHTVDRRVEQILALCERVAAGTFQSVSWAQGKPVFHG